MTKYTGHGRQAASPRILAGAYRRTGSFAFNEVIQAGFGGALEDVPRSLFRERTAGRRTAGFHPAQFFSLQ